MSDTIIGEGLNAAGKAYQQKTKQYVDGGGVAAAADKARRAIKSSEGSALEAARLQAAGGASPLTLMEVVKKEHRTQRTLMRLILKTHGDSRGRKEMFGRFTRGLQAHAAAEERTLYARLLEMQDTRERAAHSVAEHQAVDKLLHKLKALPMESPDWLSTFEQLVEKNKHHLKEEEKQVFPLAEQHISITEQYALASDFATIRDAEKARLRG